MKMTEVGQHGVLSEIVKFREEIAKELDREIVIHPKRLKEDYHVSDPAQRQNPARMINAMVGTFVNVQKKSLLSYNIIL